MDYTVSRPFLASKTENRPNFLKRRKVTKKETRFFPWNRWITFPWARGYSPPGHSGKAALRWLGDKSSDNRS